MFIGGYQIVDFSKFTIDMANGSTASIQVGRDFASVLLNSRKPLCFKNVSIINSSVGKVNIEGYASKFIAGNSVNFQLPSITMSIFDNNDIIRVELGLGD